MFGKQLQNYKNYKILEDSLKILVELSHFLDIILICLGIFQDFWFSFSVAIGFKEENYKILEDSYGIFTFFGYYFDLFRDSSIFFAIFQDLKFWFSVIIGFKERNEGKCFQDSCNLYEILWDSQPFFGLFQVGGRRWRPLNGPNALNIPLPLNSTSEFNQIPPPFLDMCRQSSKQIVIIDKSNISRPVVNNFAAIRPDSLVHRNGLISPEDAA